MGPGPRSRKLGPASVAAVLMPEPRLTRACQPKSSAGIGAPRHPDVEAAEATGAIGGEEQQATVARQRRGLLVGRRVDRRSEVRRWPPGAMAARPPRDPDILETLGLRPRRGDVEGQPVAREVGRRLFERRVHLGSDVQGGDQSKPPDASSLSDVPAAMSRARAVPIGVSVATNLPYLLRMSSASMRRRRERRRDGGKHPPAPAAPQAAEHDTRPMPRDVVP